MNKQYDSFESLLEKASKILNEGAEPVIKTTDMVQGPNGKNNHKPVTVADIRGEGPYTTTPEDPIPMLPWPLEQSPELIASILVSMADMENILMSAHSNPSISMKNKQLIAEAVKKMQNATKDIKYVAECISRVDNVKY